MRIEINGEIVGNGQKSCADDFCPQDFKNAISDIRDGEQIDIHITSPGGSVIDGNVIISLIKELQSNGHKVNSYIHGIAASMASAVACACDELHIDSNAVMMIHLPWSCVQGNSADLKKEAAILDMMTKTLVQIYKTKFNKSEDEIVQMLSQETWILGEETSSFGLKCVVDNSTSEPLKIAAKYTKKFKNMPKFFNKDKYIEGNKSMEKEEIKETEETSQEEVKEETEVVEQEETPVEQPEEVKKEDDPMTNEEFLETSEEEKEEEKPTYEELEEKVKELQQKIEELEKNLEEAEKPVEDRISGIQSAMQKNFNAKITDFTNQLKIKDAALKAANDHVDSLTKDFETCKKELSNMTTAYEAKDNALATLNARVNALPEETPTMEDGLAKCATPKERVEFLTSGKYTR